MNNPKMHSVKASPETVVWGNFDNARRPVLSIKSGDIVSMELLTHRAGDAPEMMDEAVAAVYAAKTEKGLGCHILTGPIRIESCGPGDVLECKILDLQPRLAYGANLTTGNGVLAGDMPDQHQITIYKICGDTGWAKAEFAYLTDRHPGLPADLARKRVPFLQNVRVPVRLHPGIAGVAPLEKGAVDTTLPGIYGGNVDNRNFTAGTSMYYPVQVEGGLFSAGDSHFALGDGEACGTGIEGHVNAVVQFFVRKDIVIHNQVLETPTHWIVHAFHADLNEAMRLAVVEAVDFLVANKKLGRLEAYSLLSVAGDFAVTQAVNGTKGIHGFIRKDMF